jgi:hypothetical protein
MFYYILPTFYFGNQSQINLKFTIFANFSKERQNFVGPFTADKIPTLARATARLLGLS